MTRAFRLTFAVALLAALVAVPALAADKLPNVVVLATGGTIAGAAASDVQAGTPRARWASISSWPPSPRPRSWHRCGGSRSPTSAPRI